MLPRFALISLLAVCLFSTGTVFAEKSATHENERESWRSFGVASGVAGLMFLSGAIAYRSAANRNLDDAREAMDDELELRGEERKHTAVVLGTVGATALVGGILAYVMSGNDKTAAAGEVRVQPILTPTSDSQYAGLSVFAAF